MTLRSDELARIWAAGEAWLEQTCTITRPSGAQTTDGFASGADTTIAAAVPCRAQPSGRGGQERVAGAGVASAAAWSIVLAAGVAAVKAQDVIAVDGVGVFEVVSATSGSGVQLDTVAYCVRRDA